MTDETETPKPSPIIAATYVAHTSGVWRCRFAGAPELALDALASVHGNRADGIRWAVDQLAWLSRERHEGRDPQWARAGVRAIVADPLRAGIYPPLTGATDDAPTSIHMTASTADRSQLERDRITAWKATS